MRTAQGIAHYALTTTTLLLGVALLALAWPRLHAGVRYLPVDLAISRYFSDRQIPSDRLAVLIGFADEAIQRHDHYRYHEGLSLLHYLRGLDVNTPALERRPAYAMAAAEAAAVVQRAPAQTGAWLRLASIRWILHDEPEDIIQPWKMSIFTARMDAALLVQRVEIGLAYWPYLDDEAVAMLRDQMLLAWRLQPGTLVGMLARRDRPLTVTRQLLANTDPVAIDEMESWIGKLR